MSSSLPRYLEDELGCFNAQFPDLVPEHEGEFVLFSGGKHAGFFTTYESAFESGLRQFGVDGRFLIQRLIEVEPVSVSISWESGIAFGQAGEKAETGESS